MTPLELSAIIKRLPRRQPITEALSRALALRGQLTCPPQYPTQKDHWLGWIAGYDGPGAYGRENPDRSAAFVYNHIQCPPMLMWLAEASGLPRRVLLDARTAVLAAPPVLATQSGRLRRQIPWLAIAATIGGRP
jgi:hypothetical protein